MFALSTLLLAPLLAPPQSGGFYVEGCNLGCNSGPNQVSCGIVNTFVNQEVRLQFTQPVALSSVNPATFRLLETTTGSSPAGSTLIDPKDPHTLVFRPALTFNPLGVPSFGFQQGASYQIEVPGQLAGAPPPYVTSTGGRPNQSRVLCTITTDQGIVDYVPGNPVVQVLVDVIDPVTGQVLRNQPAHGQKNVDPDTEITIVFEDLMNLGTVVIPANGLMPFITIKSGTPAVPTNHVLVAGTTSFSIDEDEKTTTLRFKPGASLPELGADDMDDRAYLVTIPSNVVDMVGNPIAVGSGFTVFRVAGPTAAIGASCAPASGTLACEGSLAWSDDSMETLRVRAVPMDAAGFLLASTTSTAQVPFGNGSCLAPPLMRSPISSQATGGGQACGGALSFEASAWLRSRGLPPGTLVRVQAAWSDADGFALGSSAVIPVR